MYLARPVCVRDGFRSNPLAEEVLQTDQKNVSEALLSSVLSLSLPFFVLFLLVLRVLERGWMEFLYFLYYSTTQKSYMIGIVDRDARSGRQTASGL